jgi:hypothetical protein
VPIVPIVTIAGRKTAAAGTIPSTSSAAEPAAPMVTVVTMFLISRSPSSAADRLVTAVAVLPAAAWPVTHAADWS